MDRSKAEVVEKKHYKLNHKYFKKVKSKLGVISYMGELWSQTLDIFKCQAKDVGTSNGWM